jgi:3-hydroxyacyl-[acyl-carrier-protein] dehydratase
VKHLIKAVQAAGMGRMKTEADGTAVKQYCFSPDSEAFSGHFPGYPLLPAIVQILTALVTIEEKREGPLELLSIEKAKFRQQILPGQPVEVRCREGSRGDQQILEADFFTDEGLAASFVLVVVG